MKKLIIAQTIIIFLTILDVLQTIHTLGNTTGCLGFNYSFYIRITLFIISSIIAILIFRKEKKMKNILLYTPMLIIIASLFLIFSYKLEYVRIYEQWVGGAKTWESFDDEEKPCDLFFINILKNR